MPNNMEVIILFVHREAAWFSKVIDLMLGYRLRRWSNNKSTLYLLGLTLSKSGAT